MTPPPKKRWAGSAGGFSGGVLPRVRLLRQVLSLRLVIPKRSSHLAHLVGELLVPGRFCHAGIRYRWGDIWHQSRGQLGLVVSDAWLNGPERVLTESRFSTRFSPSLSYVGQGMCNLFMRTCVLYTEPTPTGIIMGFPTTVSMNLGMITGWAILSPLAKHKGWAPGPVSSSTDGSRGWIVSRLDALFPLHVSAYISRQHSYGYP